MFSAALARLGRMGPIPRMILFRCLTLSAAALAGALAITLAAGAYTPGTYPALACAASLRDSGLLLFGAGLFGSALMEDALSRH